MVPIYSDITDNINGQTVCTSHDQSSEVADMRSDGLLHRQPSPIKDGGLGIRSATWHLQRAHLIFSIISCHLSLGLAHCSIMMRLYKHWRSECHSISVAATFYCYPEGKYCLNIGMHASLRASLDLCPLYIIKYFISLCL